MRIGIDARFLSHPQAGGFKSYTTHLVRALAHIDTENEYVLYLDRAVPDHGLLPVSAPNVRTRVVEGRLAGIGPVWREQVGLARGAARDRLDVFHSPALTAPWSLGCPLVVTIHDMIWYEGRPTGAGGRSVKRQLMWWYYRVVAARAIARARVVLTVSRSAAEHILDVFPSVRDRMFVTYEAAGAGFVPTHDQAKVSDVRRRHGLPLEYVLALGSADPRKNLHTLLDAYARMPEALRARWPLVITWAHPLLADDVSARIARLGLRDRIVFVRRAAEEDMPVLYQQASAFVFPSRQEGFGLPLLEAMASGTPVVAADNSSIPEVAGDAALLVDASNADALATAMATVLTDPGVRADLVTRGIARAGVFSWERCARETLSGYRSALTAPESRQSSQCPDPQRAVAEVRSQQSKARAVEPGRPQPQEPDVPESERLHVPN